MKITASKKQLLGLGAATGALAPSANALIIIASNLPLSPPATDGDTNWDVDADGTNDFTLGFFASSSANFLDFDDTNGGRLVVPDNMSYLGIAKLNEGFSVGNSSLMNGFKFHTNPQYDNTIINSFSIGSAAQEGGWQMGDTGYFGFKFTTNGGADTHYGWGEMSTEVGVSNFTVVRAYYESTPDTAIQVGAVPEPATVGLGLGALALGAAGLRRMRQRVA